MEHDTAISFYLNKLQKLVELQNKINHFHRILNEFYPIAIVEFEEIFIFDYDNSLKVYKFIKSETNTLGIPQGVRAAFPLECYYNKACVVVSGEIFDSLEGQIIIFHENVHCYQFNTCELEIRKEIVLAQKSVNTKDYYWELQYPFPYDEEEVVDLIDSLLNSLKEKNLDRTFQTRNQLRHHLSNEQYEYMIWQEWKEGLARYIENIIKGKLGIPLNHNGGTKPYNRSTFYETGSRLIELVAVFSSDQSSDIKKLFNTLKDNSMKV